MESFEAAISETVRNIWTVILGLEIQDSGSDLTALKKVDSAPTLTALVHISGAWDGTIMLYCTVELARRAAAAMFGTAPEAIGQEETEDALGELANMTAGTIKTLLPRPCSLSLPTVGTGIDYRMVVPGSHITSKVILESEEEPLLVTLLEKNT
jgi:chemotaxis protein CheX